MVGFGVGSFLTPVLALRTGFGAAVAAVGIAHFFGSALRFWLLRHAIDRRALMTFGTLSAIGGLVGNQGGLRAVGLLEMDLKKTAFVATATAVALIVDVVRLPVYIATSYHELTGIGWKLR